MSGIVQSGALFLSSFPLAINITVFGDASCSDSTPGCERIYSRSYVNLPTSTLAVLSICDRPEKLPSLDDHCGILLFPSWGKLVQYGSQSQGFIRHVHKFICPNFDRIPKLSQFYITQVLRFSCLVVSCLHNKITIQFKLRKLCDFCKVMRFALIFQAISGFSPLHVHKFTLCYLSLINISPPSPRSPA
jgi:hypothetical protein